MSDEVEEKNNTDETTETPEESTNIPEEKKDRTGEQFEKLTESNKELKQQVEGEKKKYKNLLESLRPSQVPQDTQNRYQQPINQAPSASNFQGLNQQEVNNAFAGMIDQDGYVDGQKLMGLLNDMNRRAVEADQRSRQAEQRAQQVQQQSEESQKSTIAKAVHSKYPALDPDHEEFNEDFYNLVRNEMIGQMMEGGEDMMAAADKWGKKLYNNDMTKKEREEKAISESKKQQINAVRPRSSSQAGYFANVENDTLQEQVRYGKKGAIGELLKRREQGKA